MKVAPFIILGAFIAVLSGCTTSQPVRTETVSTGGDRFDLEEQDRFTVNLTRANTRDLSFGPQIQQEARETLVDEFEERGFTLVDSNRADIEIVFATYTERDSEAFDSAGRQPVAIVTEERTIVDEDGRAVFGGTEVTTTRRAEPIQIIDSSRVFVVDVINPETNELVWRGYTRRADTDLDEGIVTNEIRRIVSAYPYRHVRTTAVNY